MIDAWNEMICAAAEKSGFVCTDISTAFNGEDGRKPSGALLAGDYTHPSQRGNDLIGHLQFALTPELFIDPYSVVIHVAEIGTSLIVNQRKVEPHHLVTDIDQR